MNKANIFNGPGDDGDCDEDGDVNAPSIYASSGDDGGGGCDIPDDVDED